MKESIGFIAVGQGGGNIGTLLEKNDYNVLYLNTSLEDLDTLKTSKFKHHIKNGEGCNKDRDKAKELIIGDFEAISEQIKSKLQEEYIYVIFSAGGGTGSGASPMLVDLLINNTNKKVGAITILPAKTEPLKTYINSYECFKELESIENMCCTFILDNNTGDKLSINKTFADLFESFIEIPQFKSVKGNIDKAEIKELLSTRGAAHICKLGKTTSSTPRLISTIKENIFAPLEPDKVIKYMGISTVTNIDTDALIKEFGSCLDIYQSTNQIHTVCMLCGLSFPYSTLETIKSKVMSSQDDITRNLKATQENKLDDDINFVNRITTNSTIAPKSDTKDIFAKYRRK